jgi:DnaD/phage-associated family protein
MTDRQADPRAFGFPARPEATAIPNVFFTDLLPHLTGQGELAVVLCALHAVAQKRGFPRYLTREDLERQPGVSSLRQTGRESRQALSGERRAEDSAFDLIDAALRRAVELNILMPLALEQGGERVQLYFLNTPADRRAYETVRSGHIDLGRIVRDATVPTRRTTVFALYESHVGTISPMVAEELAEAERLYPPEWLEAAFREAAAQNARSWRYISRILERWAREGPDHATTERGAAEDRYFRGKYGRILKQRLQP